MSVSALSGRRYFFRSAFLRTHVWESLRISGGERAKRPAWQAIHATRSLTQATNFSIVVLCISPWVV